MSHPGYAGGSVDVDAWLSQLEQHMHEVPGLMRSIDPVTLLWRKSTTSWSPQEIIGHLVDSSINNLKRFTEAQFSKGIYSYATYSPDDLVRINRYQEMKLEDILQLWVTLNRQIAYVISHAGTAILKKEVRSNLDGSPVHSIAWIFCDFVGHLQHHLRQIDAIIHLRVN